MSATASAEPPVDACTHAVQFNELCALCGKDLSTAIDDAYEAKHAVLHNSSNLKVTDEVMIFACQPFNCIHNRILGGF